MRRLVSVAVATVLVLSLAGTAFAAKGGNGGVGSTGGSGGAWIVLNPPTALSVTGTDTATFSIYQTKTSNPYVRVNCTVNGVLAYSQLLGYFPSWPYGQTFTFSSNYLNWNYENLPLNCSGILEYLNAKGGEQALASTSFAVSP